MALIMGLYKYILTLCNTHVRLLSTVVIKLPAPKNIEPSNWPGSKHAQCDTLKFSHAGQITSAKAEALKDLHAVSPTSNHNPNDTTTQPISTLANPVNPKEYTYTQGPEVSINYVSVKMSSRNKFGIPKGEYVLMNRASRTPMKDIGKGYTYEFPGRVWKNSGDAAMSSEADRQKVLIASELGMDEATASKLEIKQLMENLAPAAGNTSMLHRVSAVELPEAHVNKLIDEWGASYESDTEVIKIARPCDGGIIQGIELIPKAKIKDYLAQKAKEGNVIAESTYAALHLAVSKKRGFFRRLYDATIGRVMGWFI